MIEVKPAYIQETINELVHLIGIKENIPRKKIYNYFRYGKMEKCVKEIAEYMGLPIIINLSYVPSYFRPSHATNSGFQSESLSTTDRYRGTGDNGIIAQVSIPRNLPVYGSKELVGYPIDIKVSENAQVYPDSFFAIIAHELSHIVLSSIRHKQKDNEIFTDITAMLLGFSEITKNGRKIQEEHQERSLLSTTTFTSTTTYGYLSDRSFWFAYNSIDDYLFKLKKVNKENLRTCYSLMKQFRNLKKSIERFNGYLSILDKIKSIKINPDDAKKIVLFHKLRYTFEIESFIDIKQKIISTEINNYRKIKHLFPDSINKLDDQLVLMVSEIKQKRNSLENDLKILKKYIDYHIVLTSKIDTFIKKVLIKITRCQEEV